MNPPASLTRRSLLAAGATLPLLGCGRTTQASYTGGWVGSSPERGHRLRDVAAGGLPAAPSTHRADVVIVGAGIAGLAAARALARAGIDDVHLFELEDEAGGNSRGHALGGMACPLGAHYLPVPGEAATEVIELLDELGLRRLQVGMPVHEERHLVHSPQERLFIAGAWHEGLLPPVDALPAAQRNDTLAQYRRFAAEVREVRREAEFVIPTARARWSALLQSLDALSFGAWLDARGLTAPALRWYLDYCCRDDYGAGPAQVSAWAGLHYFASRHGFHAPGDEDDGGEREAVFTWPEGNAWLSRRLAAPLGQRLHGGCVALAVRPGRHVVQVDLWNTGTAQAERWTARQVVLAVPLFIARRLLDAPPPALAAAADLLPHAPWLVANLHLGEALIDPGGMAPAWDNVIYGSAALGYVDAMHQSFRPHPGPTVLTAYWALGGDSAAMLRTQREGLLAQPWSSWAQRVLDDLVLPHPDLAAKLLRIDLTRHGHAMAVPVPGARGHAALQQLALPQGRLHFAHADLSAYSVFEEAMYHGTRAARQVLQALRGA